MTLTIRPATSDDHPAISRAARELGELHARALPEWFRSSSDPLTLDYLRFLLDSDAHEIVVAERDAHIVGYVVVELRETPDVPILRPRRYVLVHEIGVLEAERGQGIGRLLMAWVARWAGDRGATTVELQVYAFDGSAIGFYERLGFREVKRAMALPVEPAGENAASPDQR